MSLSIDFNFVSTHSTGGQTKLAIVGCGEVGRVYAAASAAHTDLVLCDTHPSPLAQSLADELGVELHRTIGSWLADVDEVWSCVTGDVAAAVAEQVLGRLRPGAVYVDMSTATPADKLASSDRLAAAGVGYADAVILGAIAVTGVETALLVSGPSATTAVDHFTKLGAPAKALAGRAGDAAALKLLRTVLTKGLEALAVECLVAAEKQGVRRELYGILDDIDQTGFAKFLDAIVRTHVVHAERRSHEVDRAVAQLDEANLPSSVLAGTRGLFEHTVDALHTTPPASGAGDDIESALAWLMSVSEEHQHV